MNMSNEESKTHEDILLEQRRIKEVANAFKKDERGYHTSLSGFIENGIEATKLIFELTEE